MPFEKGLGSAAISFGASGCRPRWRSRRLPPSGFIDAGGRAADSVVGALDGIRLRRRFSRRRSSGGRAGASFPFGALPPAVWHAEAPSDGFAILLQAHGRLRSSRFIVRRRMCRRKPFFEADGRRRTCLGAGLKPDRSAGGVRYAVVPEPLRVLSVAYATACGGTGRRDFLFGAIWGRRLVPPPTRTAAGRNDGRTGPEREDRLLATRQRRAEAAMRWSRSLRRPFGVLRPSCGAVRTPVVPHSSFDPVRRFRRRSCRRYAGGGRGIERDGTERSPRFRIFGTK